MTDSRILPGARARLVDANGITTREFYDFFRRLQDAEETIAEIRQIAEALGSPDGDPANIPPLDFVSDDAQITGGVGINVSGTLADGAVNVRLAELGNTGEGQALAFSRDNYGRVAGTRLLTPDDILNPYAVYLVDEDGAFLVDENGNFLVSSPAPGLGIGAVEDQLLRWDNTAKSWVPVLASDLTDAADDAAAASAGVAVNAAYRTGSILKVRVS